MALYPKAIKKLIPAGSNDPRIDAVGIVYHVAVSKSDSLYDFFLHDGGIESHFYVRFDGTVEQYRDTAFEADANYLGNSWGSPRKGMLSVETEGMGPGKWTAAQVQALKDLTVWCSQTHHFPIRKATGPYSGGVGYHCQFKDWNPHVHSCPGPARVQQFDSVFVPWFADALAPKHVKRKPNVLHRMVQHLKGETHAARDQATKVPQPKRRKALTRALKILRSIKF